MGRNSKSFGQTVADHCGSMDSLPPPQDLVEDEVAAMVLKAAKEGVHAWLSLADADRLIQVWRWLTDSETNLRTLRLRVGKEASLRREESEEANRKREAAEEEKSKILELEERVEELEQDNRAIAFELKEALRDADVLRAASQNDQKPTLEGEEMFLETRLANLEDRMEAVLERQDGERRRWKE